jgi:peptide/nickel transport system permease protein
MGTNNVGQDMLTRVLYGGIVPIQIAMLATALALAIGTFLGLTSGYQGGKYDRSISIFMDGLYAFPGLILAIAITAVLGANVFNTTAAVGAIYVPSFYRMARGQTLQLKEVPYVEGARSLGESSSSVMFRYILPSLLPAIAVVSSLSFADAILIEAGLSFIGLPAVTPPSPDWGFDIASGKSTLLSGSWWMITFPGLMIILVVLSFSLIGEGLNDRFNLNFGVRR